MPVEMYDEGICTIPPEGWWCSRKPGHEGPCAARPIEEPWDDLLNGEERAMIDRAWEKHKAAMPDRGSDVGGSASDKPATEAAVRRPVKSP